MRSPVARTAGLWRVLEGGGRSPGAQTLRRRPEVEQSIGVRLAGTSPVSHFGGTVFGRPLFEGGQDQEAKEWIAGF